MPTIGLNPYYTYTAQQLLDMTIEKNNEESFPNGLKVSETNNPLYFPAKYTYQVGSAEIVALASNAIAVGTGQTGAAPLYVFCKDGIYALFVDSSGEMAYTNARVIARDVCNNAKSVTPIDAGVVFTTDRGLMMIAGEQVDEIGQPLEGDYEQITPNTDLIGKGYALQKLAGLPTDSVTSIPFLVYLKGAIINYNHNERELMVSNPNYNYTYVLDRDNNWTRRNFTADEYVQNYPTSYRLTFNDGLLRQVDNESDADNGMFVLTRALKLDSIGFKELHRVVARGWFEVPHEEVVKLSGKQIGSSGAQVTLYRKNLDSPLSRAKKGTVYLTPKNYSPEVQSILRITYTDGRVEDKDFSDVSSFELTEEMSSIVYYILLPGSGYLYFDLKYEVEQYLDLYIQGSYDARKWATLGVQRRKGKFTDIGALIERTDCRYFRFVLAGKLTKESRFDYFEVSSKRSQLGTKIR